MAKSPKERGLELAIFLKIKSLRAELEAVKAALREHVAALTNLTAGGSEYFGKCISEVYLADIPFCTQRIRERMGYRVEELKATARVTQLEAENGRLREALEGACAQILDSYRTWVAVDMDAHPRPGQIPRYDAARAALTGREG